jgi:hypothetical protein
MNNRSSICKRHRFPPEIIQHVVWLYHRFSLSARDIEDRGVSSSALSTPSDFAAGIRVTVMLSSSMRSS